MTERALADSDLHRGSALALENAGHLLADALLLYERRRYPSAVILAVFSREETGRSQILSGLARSVSEGERVTPSDVDDACDDHKIKLRKAFSGVTLPIGPELGKKLAQVLGNPRHPEYAKYRNMVNDTAKAVARSDRKHTHGKRLRALYVDLDEDGTWNRPADWTREEAFVIVDQAASDYAMRQDELCQAANTEAALGEWLEQHPLPPAEFPTR